MTGARGGLEERWKLIDGQRALFNGNPRTILGFPHSSLGKESACNAGNLGSIPGSGRSPGVGNGNPLQYSCLENPMDRGAWRATVHSVAKSRVHLNAIFLKNYFVFT